MARWDWNVSRNLHSDETRATFASDLNINDIAGESLLYTRYIGAMCHREVKGAFCVYDTQDTHI